MGVDKPGGHEEAVEVDDPVCARGETSRGVVRAKPRDDAVLDEDGLREGVCRGVNDAIAIQSGGHPPDTKARPRRGRALTRSSTPQPPGATR